MSGKSLANVHLATTVAYHQSCPTSFLHGRRGGFQGISKQRISIVLRIYVSIWGGQTTPSTCWTIEDELLCETASSKAFQ